MVLNLAEGSGRYSSLGRRNFYIISRSSVYECVSIINILYDIGDITQKKFQMYYEAFEEISKMLFALIKSQKRSTSSNTHY